MLMQVNLARNANLNICRPEANNGDVRGKVVNVKCTIQCGLRKIAPACKDTCVISNLSWLIIPRAPHSGCPSLRTIVLGMTPSTAYRTGSSVSFEHPLLPPQLSGRLVLMRPMSKEDRGCLVLFHGNDDDLRSDRIILNVVKENTGRVSFHSRTLEGLSRIIGKDMTRSVAS